MEPILFNIFINCQDDRTEHPHSKYSHDTKLGGLADRLDASEEP